MQVRLSSRQLRQADSLVAAVQAALETSGLAPSRLDLKVAEASLQGNEAKVLPVLRRLRALGVRLTLADCQVSPRLLHHLQSFQFHGIAFGADCDPTGMQAELAAAGVDRIGSYVGSPIPTSAIPAALQLKASASHPDAGQP